MSEAPHHTILLSHGRELRIGVAGGNHAAVLYIPEAPRDELRKLSIRANVGDLAALQRLKALPKTRQAASGITLHDALEALAGDSFRPRERREVEGYCELMGWASAAVVSAA